MNTVQKNFTLTEGSRSRIVVNLPKDVDPNNYEILAGNDKCKFRHLIYETVEYGDHFISIISEPAPPAGYPLPYQLFVKDKVSNVEWLLVSGQVTILQRIVGAYGTASEEITAPLNEQIIEVNINFTYSKEDLDEAVQRALEAAENAEFWANKSMAWAEGDPGSTSHSSKYWSNLACLYKQQTCEYLDEVTGIAASKQDKLTAGRNIVITKSGDDTFICALGGGTGGGDVYTDRSNNFLECNVFDANVSLKSGAEIPYCASDFRSQYKLTNYCGNLYWGCSKLNDQGGGSDAGDVYTNRPNTFVCSNTFCSDTQFNSNAHFNGYSVFERNRMGIYNQCGNAHYFDARRESGVENLYWNGVKLNNQGGGGGDVYTDRNNNFTGVNTFQSNVNFNSLPVLNCGIQFTDCGIDKRGSGILSVLNNDLYWGNSKLNDQGGAVTPTFITLTPTTEVKHGKTYKAQPQTGVSDFSNITVEQYGTSEIWFEITNVTAVTLPSDWSWVDNIVPAFVANNRYLIEVRSDGYAIIAKLKYSYNYGN